MAEEVEVQSQPSNAREIVAKHLANLEPEPEAPIEAEAAPEVESFDPATIKIPNRQFVTNVPKALEKFKDKTLVDFATSYEEAERQMHAKSAEAATLRRENETLNARLAAAEQYARMTPQTPQAAPDPWQGLNPDEAIITDTRKVLNTTLSQAELRATAIAQESEQRIEARIQEREMQKDRATKLIGALEAARMQASKLYGEEIPLAKWQSDLQYIAPVVVRENETNQGRVFDPNAYVEHYTRWRGAPQKVSVPAEGNPPVATRAATVQSERQAPSLSREAAALNKQIRRALKLES